MDDKPTIISICVHCGGRYKQYGTVVTRISCTACLEKGHNPTGSANCWGEGKCHTGIASTVGGVNKRLGQKGE